MICKHCGQELIRATNENSVLSPIVHPWVHESQRKGENVYCHGAGNLNVAEPLDSDRLEAVIETGLLRVASPVAMIVVEDAFRKMRI